MTIVFLLVLDMYEEGYPNQWMRTHGNEHWEFDEDGLMRIRDTSANDYAIKELDRGYKQMYQNIGCQSLFLFNYHNMKFHFFFSLDGRFLYLWDLQGEFAIFLLLPIDPFIMRMLYWEYVWDLRSVSLFFN